MSIVALVPARSGSKGVVDKNIADHKAEALFKTLKELE